VKLQERELTGHRQSHQVLSEKQRQMETATASLRDEIAKLKSVYVQKERQFQHELRKKDKEFEKLKDQLASFLKDMQLREQKSEIYYNPNQSIREALKEDSKESMDDDQAEESIQSISVDRVSEIEGENDKLRQIISFTYGSLVQLLADLFPEIEIDQSILSLLETSPMTWIEEQMAQKIEEVFEILKDNLAEMAQNQQSSILKSHQDQFSRLNSQLQTANSTISTQSNAIKSLEQQVKQYNKTI
jgi:X breakpoint 2-interacting protein